MNYENKNSFCVQNVTWNLNTVMDYNTTFPILKVRVLIKLQGLVHVLTYCIHFYLFLIVILFEFILMETVGLYCPVLRRWYNIERIDKNCL